jgi:nucleotidyltransferase/DNA polymerase involved in DNA repair
LSLDEAYLDVTENLQGIALERDVALAIRAKIKVVTGLNASAGISYNKFLAKLASDHRKPNGQYVITPGMGPAFVEGLPVGKFHGIGPATSAKMNSLGLYTGLDMRNHFLEHGASMPQILTRMRRVLHQCSFGDPVRTCQARDRPIDESQAETRRPLLVRRSISKFRFHADADASQL